MQINTTIVGEIVDMVTQILGLFSIFPLNVIIVGSLGGIAFVWFQKAKRAAQ